MPKRLSSMHARTICHETEDIARVEHALRTLVGDAQVERSTILGHHGNVIEVLESSSEDEALVLGALTRMTDDDLEEFETSLEARTDDSCQLFIRFDKQEAYADRLRLSAGEDVVAVRIKVRAFPAKKSIATGVVRDLLKEVAAARETSTQVRT